jgi:DNA-directed RNA polymerase subunit K/omega
MDETSEVIESIDAVAVEPEIPSEPLPPIQSRFLFVDVAALRAKQLRKGARVRFEREPGLPAPNKAERVAMEEVRRGLVFYNVPPLRKGIAAGTDE